MGVLTSDPMLYSHNHSLDGIAEMVVTAASAAVSSVIGMIGIEAGLSVQNAAMTVQWYGLLPSPHLGPRHPFLLTASTSSTRQTRSPYPKHTYTSSASDASSCSAMALHGTRFPSATHSQSRSPPPDRQNPCTHQARSIRRRYPNPSPPPSCRSARDA